MTTLYNKTINATLNNIDTAYEANLKLFGCPMNDAGTMPIGNGCMSTRRVDVYTISLNNKTKMFNEFYKVIKHKKKTGNNHSLNINIKYLWFFNKTERFFLTGEPAYDEYGRCIISAPSHRRITFNFPTLEVSHPE